MARTRPCFRRLAADRRGTALIEFALVAPFFLTALIGVIQVALYLQAYNAVRNVTGDAARFAVVEYQRGNKLNGDAVADKVESIATSGLYQLNLNLLGVDVTEEASRINGVKEMSVRVQYAPPTFIPIPDFIPFKVDYSRSLFLFDPDAAVPPPPS